MPPTRTHIPFGQDDWDDDKTDDNFSKKLRDELEKLKKQQKEG